MWSKTYFTTSFEYPSILCKTNFCIYLLHICSSSRPSQLSSSIRRQVWSAVKRLDTISPKLLIMFDPHSEIFKVATNIFYPTQESNPIPFSISDDATTNWATPPKSTINHISRCKLNKKLVNLKTSSRFIYATPIKIKFKKSKNLKFSFFKTHKFCFFLDSESAQ